MDNSQYEKLLASAFHYLSYRPRSSYEVDLFLQEKSKRFHIEDEDVVAGVRKRLFELNYVNDETFAAWWLQSRQHHSPKGLKTILNELRNKRVDKTIIEAVIEKNQQHPAYQTEYELALQAVQKKVSYWGKFPKLEQKKKLFGFLARRGFDSQTIRKIIDEVVGKDYNTPME
jgi:regulatory protein